MAKRKRRKRKIETAHPDAAAPLATGPIEPENVSTKVAAPPRIFAPVDPEQTSRRDFLSGSGRILTGLCGAAATLGAVRLAVPNFDGRSESRFVLGRLSDFKMNTLTWLRDKALFVMRNAEGIGAFSAECTHLGCTVQRIDDGFLCPCHGARFDEMGTVVHGPAIRPLPWFKVVRYPDGRLWVHVDEPAPERAPTDPAAMSGE